MTHDRFAQLIAEIGVDRQQFAKLVGVTPRAVAMWCSGDRELPGPVIAYLELLRSLPSALVAKEIARLDERSRIMYDGMYSFEYQGLTGQGVGVVTLLDGVVFGHDSGVVYDGTYEPNPIQPDCVDLKLRLIVPPGVALVQGVPPQPAQYSFDIEVTIPAQGEATIVVATPYGTVNAMVRFLRGIPKSLAA